MRRRKNQAVPRWDGTKWRHRPFIDGRQRNFSSTVPGSKGYEICMKKEAAARSGKQDASALRVGELWPDFLEYVATETADGEDSFMYTAAQSIGKHHILPRVKHKKPNSMTGFDWQAVINSAKPVKRKSPSGKVYTNARTSSGELSEKTLKNIRGVITQFLKYCAFRGIVQFVPTLKIPKNRERVGKATLSTSECLELLSLDYESTGEIYIHAYQLQVILGLRPGEALGIQNADISGDFLHISRSINSKDKVTPGKNKRAQRTEYIFPDLRKIINKQLSLKKALGFNTPWLFPFEDGNQPKQATYLNHLQRLCVGQGWTVITPYSLRHNFVSVMSGRMSTDDIKLIVGHSAGMDTHGTYDARLQENVKIIGTRVASAWQDASQQVDSQLPN
jgi:integrase